MKTQYKIGDRVKIVESHVRINKQWICGCFLGKGSVSKIIEMEFDSIDNTWWHLLDEPDIDREVWAAPGHIEKIENKIDIFDEKCNLTIG